MRGNIYTDVKCPICGRNFKNDENRDGMYCAGGGRHPEIAHHGKCRVEFGVTKIRKNSVIEAQQELAFLRVQKKRGVYDPRDWRRDEPLGFATLAKTWLMHREKNTRGRALSKSTLTNYRNYMRAARRHWNQTNVKDLLARPGMIEDFLFGLDGISEKTRANYKSCLHYFFRWVCRREKLPMPEFPDVPYELRYRTITDLPTQQAIMDEVRRQTFRLNPKIALGVEILATYTNIRPQDLLRLNEADIDLGNSVLTFWNPTKVKHGFKTVRLLPEHMAEFDRLKKAHPALPGVPFFRHTGGVQGTRPDQPFGEKYFYKCWAKACAKLGVPDVPLYPGTRHTTATEQARRFGHDAARSALGNTSNKSIERYIRVKQETDLDVVRMTVAARGGKVLNFPQNLPNDKKVENAD